MGKKLWLLVLGLGVAVVPFLGLPGSWKSFLTVALGLAVAILAFLDRQEEIRRDSLKPREGSGVFVENGAAASYEESSSRGA